MLRSMNTAVSGMQNHQTMLDTVSNNIANVDTDGFKSSSVSFKTLFSQSMAGASSPSLNLGGTNPEQVGLGMTIAATSQNMTEGSAQQTGVPSDVMIQGNGFFRVSSDGTNLGSFKDGDPALATTPALTNGTNTEQVQFTRNGNFTFDAAGNLVTQAGQYVVGYPPIINAAVPGPPVVPASSSLIPDTTSDIKINVPPGSQSFSISQTDGKVSYVDSKGNPQVAGFISMATFPNPAGLQPVGGTNWVESPNSGAVNTAPTKAGDAGPLSGGVVQSTGSVASDLNTGTGGLLVGALEGSNVDLATEFSNMITAERGFQANSRMITTSDQILQTLDQLGQ